jgi:hypothetical protein
MKEPIEILVLAAHTRKMGSSTSKTNLMLPTKPGTQAVRQGPKNKI